MTVETLALPLAMAASVVWIAYLVADGVRHARRENRWLTANPPADVVSCIECFGRAATADDLAAELGWDLDATLRALQDARSAGWAIDTSDDRWVRLDGFDDALEAV